MKVQIDDILITTKDFMNKKFVDIRKYYHDVDSGTEKPTAKGIMLSKKTFYKVLEALNINKKHIDEYFGE